MLKVVGLRSFYLVKGIAHKKEMVMDHWLLYFDKVKTKPWKKNPVILQIFPPQIRQWQPGDQV